MVPLSSVSHCYLIMHFCFQFFVASDPAVKTDRLWHDKYTLRKSMIPSFMTMDQSRKVGLEENPVILRLYCSVYLNYVTKLIFN